MNKDDVATAFELILDELDAFLENTGQELAELARKGNFTATKPLADTGEQVKAFRGKLVDLAHEWEKGLDAGTRERVKLDNVQTLASHNKAPKTGLLVKFPSGKTLNSPTAAETFALAIKEIGLDRVQKLGKRVANVPLVSPQKHEQYSQYQLGALFVMTHSSTQAKKDLLDEIANELGDGMTVQIVK